ncbi:MAG TPA: acetyl-CoA C-acetyltransferase [Thermoanaerobaculia bacterium]|nr:acetyl-CoA C-acetyltransferase [Thermoanaerobaculia bacterium]
MKNLVVLSAVRTPIGSFLGKLSSLSANELGAAAIRCGLERARVPADRVEQVIMGNVLQAGQGQAPARQAAIKAGVPNSVPCVTVHKVCGSGMRAVMDAANAIRAEEYEVAVAGGMESMSNAPYLLDRVRTGYRMGHGTLVDSMIKDGLWDPYDDVHMGSCAEACVSKYSFTREEQDAYALESYRRAQEASKSGLAAGEITPVEVPQKKGGAATVDSDEEPFAAPLEKIGTLKPAFEKNGSVTAGNSSKINDGAAALVVSSAEWAARRGAKPLARIVAYGGVAQAPKWFTTAPVGAIRNLLEKTGFSVADVDLFEINEAFAAVALAAIRDLGLDPAKVNVRGGAVAIGHPIGASGARILTTLVHSLRHTGGRRGIAAICIGGGEATAMLVERET